jgi:hypothetical protein
MTENISQPVAESADEDVFDRSYPFQLPGLQPGTSGYALIAPAHPAVGQSLPRPSPPARTSPKRKRVACIECRQAKVSMSGTTSRPVTPLELERSETNQALRPWLVEMRRFGRGLLLLFAMSGTVATMRCGLGVQTS